MSLLRNLSTPNLQGFTYNAPAPNAPTVVTQPISANVVVGDQVQFSAVFQNALSVQWYRNGQPISGATASDYSLAAALVNDGDTFYAIASGAGNTSVQTAIVTLSVSVVDPTIDGPGDLTVQVPEDQRIVFDSHVAIMNWIQEWSATDYQGNQANLFNDLPSSFRPEQGNVTVEFIAVDAEDNVSRQTAQIIFDVLGSEYSQPVIVKGKPDRFEQRGSRYFSIEK